MPSSLIFAGLVVLWLLILVPTVARRRQEVPRPTTAALSGRVLRRRPVAGPVRQRGEEVDAVPDTEPVIGSDPVVPDPSTAPAGRGAVDVPEARSADAVEAADRRPDEPGAWREPDARADDAERAADAGDDANPEDAGDATGAESTAVEEAADGPDAADAGVSADAEDDAEGDANTGDAEDGVPAHPGDRADAVEDTGGAATSGADPGFARPDGPIDLRGAGADGATDPETWTARPADAAADDGAGPARLDGPADVTRAGWDRHSTREPASRYRPGRGGFDPAAAARAARARYAFRQRMVLALLVAVVATGIAAVVVGTPLWWVHGAVDLVLVAYLVHLRRLVRMEEAIRARRVARMAGARRRTEDGSDDEARGQDAIEARAIDHVDDPSRPGLRDDPRVRDLGIGVAVHADPVAEPGGAPQGADCGSAGTRERADGAGPPGTGEDASRGDAREADTADDVPALPRLRPAPPLPLPSGTAPLQADDLDPELPSLDRSAPWRYRRAVGQ